MDVLDGVDFGVEVVVGIEGEFDGFVFVGFELG